MKISLTPFLCLGILAGSDCVCPAAETSDRPPPPAAIALTNLFADKVVARGKGFEIKQSQVDNAFTTFKASRVARGQTLPPSQRAAIESNLIERLIVERVLLSKAQDAERTKGQERADRIFNQYRQGILSENDLDRQLFAMGLNADQFQTLIRERAICEEVVERELGPKVQVGPEQVKKYYDDNSSRFQQPEQIKVSHILISTWDSQTKRELPEDQKRVKREQAEKILEKTRAPGQDFAALVKEYSDDTASKARNGEYVFPRGRLPVEFESASFSMQPNQISDLVTTRFGYHIIKCLERIPPRQLPFEEVQKTILEDLRRVEIEKLLPEFLKQIKQEAQVEILTEPSRP
jgi:peptidyl-prolyl cis-trans isomerase C